jgi:hypothetical protein
MPRSGAWQPVLPESVSILPDIKRTGWIRFIAPALGVVLFSGLAQASTIVSTSLSLTSLQITSGIGTVEILSPLTASAFASAYDSLGGSDANFNSVNNTAASVSASTKLANASGGASASALTASASGGVNIPGMLDATAGTSPGPYGSLSGTFEILDSASMTSPVNVTINAALSYSQSLMTDAFGEQANSEVIFQLNLPDVTASPFLFLDNPLQIGPNTTLTAFGSPTLSGSTSSLGLLTNTPYSIYIEADAESSAINTSPEPASFLLIGAGLLLIGARRQKRG